MKKNLEAMRYVFLFLVAFGFLSCTKSTDLEPIQTLPSGSYVGTFQRGSGGSVPVVLTFTNNEFSGSVSGGLGSGSGVPTDLPRICRGTFAVDKGTIHFQNTCVFTAEFDWSLILSDRWQAETLGERLVVTRNEDRYELTRQP
jgi:hypothetical protein